MKRLVQIEKLMDYFYFRKICNMQKNSRMHGVLY